MPPPACRLRVRACPPSQSPWCNSPRGRSPSNLPNRPWLRGCRRRPLHLRNPLGSGNKRVQVNSPDPSLSVHISRGSRGPKPSDLAGDAISMSDEVINSPPPTTPPSKLGQPLAARLSKAVPPPPSVPANMPLKSAASPHRPMQLSYAQALASPGR